MADTQQVIISVLQGEQLIMQSLPLALDLALKLKELFSKTNLTFNIQTITDQAIVADDETIKAVEDWKVSVGL